MRFVRAILLYSLAIYLLYTRNYLNIAPSSNLHLKSFTLGQLRKADCAMGKKNCSIECQMILRREFPRPLNAWIIVKLHICRNPADFLVIQNPINAFVNSTIQIRKILFYFLTRIPQAVIWNLLHRSLCLTSVWYLSMKWNLLEGSLN